MNASEVFCCFKYDDGSQIIASFNDVLTAGCPVDEETGEELELVSDELVNKNGKLIDKPIRVSKKKINSVVIIGRIWRQKGTGNPYHTAYVLVDGKPIDSRTVRRYGGGSCFEDTGLEQLFAKGYFSGMKIQGPAWQFFQDNKIQFFTTSIPVARESDL